MKLISTLVLLLIGAENFAAQPNVPINVVKSSFSSNNKLSDLDFLFSVEWKRPADFAKLSKQSVAYGPKAAAALMKVMKNSKYPAANRWIAMFSLTKLMGKKSARVIAKFTSHPDWMMRLASLKCLLFLKETQFAPEFMRLLNDPSLVVRQQALTNINQLGIKQAANAVDGLLRKVKADAGEQGVAITDLTVVTLAKFDHKPSVKTMIEMIKKNEFKMNSPTLDYSLEKLTGKKSPAGDWRAKVDFWNSIVSL